MIIICMDNDKQLDDLSDLVSELKNTKGLTGIMIPPQAVNADTIPEVIDETNVDDYIFRKSAMLIQQGMDTIERLKSTAMSGADSSTIEAYSKLMSSTAGAIEILNKVNLQRRKEKAAKDLKQMDMDASNKLLDKYDNGARITNQTNNIIVASREEIIKALVDKAGVLSVQPSSNKDKEFIDVTPSK